MNMDLKLSSKDYSAVTVAILLTGKGVSTLQEKLQNSKPEKFCQQNKMNSRQSFYSIAEFFVRFTTFRRTGSE